MKKIILFFLFPLSLYSQEYSYEFRGGVQIATDGSKQVWATVGSDFYFMYELGYNFPKDITYLRPGFDYRSTQIWNHERMDDIVKKLYWSVGFGNKFNKIDVHLAASMLKIDHYYHFYDSSLFSSPNGHYSFIRYTEGEISAKVGLIYDFKYFSAKTDYDFIVKRGTFGVGFKLLKKK